jgi:hypothetical protein
MSIAEARAGEKVGVSGGYARVRAKAFRVHRNLIFQLLSLQPSRFRLALQF